MNCLAKALLDSSSAAACVGPRSRRPFGGEQVGDAARQRQFGTDDGEVRLFLVGKGEDSRGVGGIDVRRAGDLGDAGVARRAHHLGDACLAGEFPGESVLAGAGANDQEFHRWVSALCGKGS